MSNKETLLIKKLFKIALNQQKILEKLAQQQDANIEYLKRAAEVAASNSGLTGGSFYIAAKPGGTVTTPSGGQAQTATGYMVTVSGAIKDNRIRQKFMDTLKAQVNAQKPELANLSIMFAD